MRITAALFCACWLLISGNVAAQTRPASLSTLFGNVYGPNGLVVNSDEQSLDGSRTRPTLIARSSRTSA